VSDNMTPEGTYMATVELVDAPEGWTTSDGKVSCQFGEAKTGTKQVAIVFKIAEGDYSGRVRTWFGYFTKDTIDRTLEALRNAGFTGDEMDKFPTQRPAALVPIVLKHEKDLNGDLRERVAFINRPGGGGVRMERPMSQTDMLTFAAGLKARLASKPGLPGATSKPNGAVSKTVDPEI
jgi:hypothetical protein